MLERSIRDARSDREMSAKDLITERDSLAHAFQKSVMERRERLELLGIPRTVMVDAGIGGGWRDRVTRTLGQITGRDTLERLLLERPEIRPEIEMWAMERDAIERRIAGLSVEIHKKFSLPAACVVFVLIGAPLGMRVRRAGPAVAFVSVAFFLFYYLCLVGGEELANRLLLPPWLSMWLPNIVLGLVGARLDAQACEIRLSPQRRAVQRVGARRRVKILDRYVLREFLVYLTLGLVGFIVIFIVVDIFEKIDVFLDHRAAFTLVARFYLYRAPEVVVQVMPVALLLATFLALGQLNKFGELTAMRSSGLSVDRILLPVYGIAVCAALGSLLLGEFVVPPASARARPHLRRADPAACDARCPGARRPHATRARRAHLLHAALPGERAAHARGVAAGVSGRSAHAARWTPPRRRGTARSGCSRPASCARSAATTRAPAPFDTSW